MCLWYLFPSPNQEQKIQAVQQELNLLIRQNETTIVRPKNSHNNQQVNHSAIRSFHELSLFCMKASAHKTLITQIPSSMYVCIYIHVCVSLIVCTMYNTGLIIESSFIHGGEMALSCLTDFTSSAKANSSIVSHHVTHIIFK